MLDKQGWSVQNKGRALSARALGVCRSGEARRQESFARTVKGTHLKKEERTAVGARVVPPDRLGLACLPLRTGGTEPEVAIWLILPVVIRSSQRLSHACLSINDSIL